MSSAPPPPPAREELPTLEEAPVPSEDLAREWSKKLKDSWKENGE